MRVFRRFFGKKNKKTPRFTKAIHHLKIVEEQLLDLQTNYIDLITAQESVARKYVIRKKKVAQQALRMKKLLEIRLRHVQRVHTCIVHQREMLEQLLSVKTNKKTLKVLVKKNKSLESAEQLLDELQRQMRISQDITEALSKSNTLEHEDEELEAELAKLCVK